MTATDIHALVGAYVLDAVDEFERAAFERHLADCAACRVEADELRETATRLADGALSVPPPRLRSDVLAAVGRTRQLPPGTPARRERDPHAAVSRWRRLTAGAAAAAVLAAGAGAAAWTIQERRVRQESTAAAEAQQKQARTQQILAAPDLVVRTEPMTGGGRVTVAFSESLNSSVVTVRADSRPAADQSLQLWTIRGTAAHDQGALPPGVQSTVQIMDGLPGNDAFAVSLEPAGGSPQPTDVLAEVEL